MKVSWQGLILQRKRNKLRSQIMFEQIKTLAALTAELSSQTVASAPAGTCGLSPLAEEVTAHFAAGGLRA